MEEFYESQLGQLLIQKKWRLAVAESCTGGLLGHRITNIPGSSAYFWGGVIVYQDQAKIKLLGVQAQTLVQFGAVSQQTVQEMASGVRALFGVELGLSISGIAGPGGGTPEKPVGLTWIGLSAPGYDQAQKFLWPGSRLQVKEQSSTMALRLAVEYMQLLR